jgi:hypothetical protein
VLTLSVQLKLRQGALSRGLAGRVDVDQGEVSLGVAPEGAVPPGAGAEDDLVVLVYSAAIAAPMNGPTQKIHCSNINRQNCVN